MGDEDFWLDAQPERGEVARGAHIDVDAGGDQAAGGQPSRALGFLVGSGRLLGGSLDAPSAARTRPGVVHSQDGSPAANAAPWSLVVTTVQVRHAQQHAACARTGRPADP
jgi:hypothetical protein